MSDPQRTVVILASTPYRGHQLYEQRLARAMRSRGHEVIYVEPPVPFVRIHSWHRENSSRVERRTAEGLRLVTPRRPPAGARVAFAGVSGLAVAVAVAWATRGVQVDGLVVTAGHPWAVRLVRRRLGAPSVAIVKDDYAAAAALIGQSPRTVIRRRRRVLSVVDHVAVVSPNLKAILLREGIRSEVIPAGCVVSQPGLAAVGTVRDIEGRKAVFIGMLSNRIDFDFVRAVVDAGWQVVVAGRQQYRFTQHELYASLKETGNVHELGELDEAGVTGLLAQCDIGLVPYTLSEFNQASFPLKTFEYLAAGLPVLATALSSVMWLDCPAIWVVGGDADVAGGLQWVETQPAEVLAEAARTTALSNTWDLRADRYAQLLWGDRR